MPDSFWDAKAGVKGADLRKTLDDLTTFKAADDVRRLALPQKADDYKLELPKDWKAPEGVTFAFDDKDPLLPQARQVMHDIDQGKLTGQEAFSKLLSLYAAGQVGSVLQIKAAKDAEIAKLGVNGPARVTAINTWLDAQGLPGIKSMLATAGIVGEFEKLISKVTAQGGAQFSQQHRETDTAQKVSDAEWEKMTPSEKRSYAAKFPQPAPQQNGRAA